MLKHGGRLQQATRQYGIPLADWLDLSTGINPHSWPVPAVPDAVWQRLPEDEDGLLEAAQNYYGSEGLLAVAGSQAAIQALPKFRKPGRVGIPRSGYAEHGQAWEKAGHQIHYYEDAELDALADTLDILVVINPNNPTGARQSLDDLLAWRSRLTRRGGLLVVDEAFMDSTPVHSLLPHCPLPGLVVLRSLGKFFGLAGLRSGFVAAESSLLDRLGEYLGPWSVSGPARWVATRALLDVPWQQENRTRLIRSGQRLEALLGECFATPSAGTVLFQTLAMPPDQAVAVADQLARQGVLVRVLDQQNGVRFGLPPESQWDRLAAALSALRHAG